MTVIPVADSASLIIQSAAGQQDTEIPLSIRAALTDSDGSESLELRIENLPSGTRLFDGIRVFRATEDNSIADISNWNLQNLRLIPPSGSDADLQLFVSATVTELSTGDQKSVVGKLNVDVRQVVVMSSFVDEGDSSSIDESADKELEGRDLKTSEQPNESGPSDDSGPIDALVNSNRHVEDRNEQKERNQSEQMLGEQHRESGSWRDLLVEGRTEVSPNWQLVERQSDNRPTSNWRLYSLDALSNANFEPVQLADDDRGSSLDIQNSLEQTVEHHVSKEEVVPKPSSARQAFGVLWMLARSLSGVMDTSNSSNVSEGSRPEARANRTQRSQK